jgi:acetyl-CoA carboxylase carboxyltransferase component
LTAGVPRRERVRAPMTASVLLLAVANGERVHAGQLLLVLEAMKMEHELRAAFDGEVAALHVAAGDMVDDGAILLELCETSPSPRERGESRGEGSSANGPAPALRADLREVIERHALTLDAARPDAVARRHAAGRRTARENVAALCEPGSFVEYGALAVAAQRSRRPLDELIAQTPADGMITGLGTVAGMPCAVLAYDATVLAGTQGYWNHRKTDRLLGVALERRLPVVLYAEGGGGRPGDTDVLGAAWLDVPTFASFARLSAQVPLVGIAAGRCFAGNAALLGCCDVIIATRDSNIGMGGPAMVEDGGLGRFAPEAIGPSELQWRNGVIDVLVDDEDAATAAAQRLMSLLCRRRVDGAAPDTTRLRDALPVQRSRVYDVRALIASLVDVGSLLELRGGYGGAVLTAFARLDGRPVALLASDCTVLGGAVDAAAADKAARFVELADTHGLPIVSLIDTPGFLVGPDAEAQAQVRHSGRLFVAAAKRRVPWLAVVLRRGFGLGAMALAGGGFHATVGIAAWPSGEFGAMGLEGAVKLGYRKELDALAEGPEREAHFEQLLQRHIAAGSAVNVAMAVEVDAVIDPAATREWLAIGLAAAKPGGASAGDVDAA